MNTKTHISFASCLLSLSLVPGWVMAATTPKASTTPAPSIHAIGQALAAAPAPKADEPLLKIAPQGAVRESSPESAWWEGKLVLGARMYNFNLADTRRTTRGRLSNSNVRGNFIGSVWGLDENQNYIPRLNLGYWFTPYLGVGLTYDEVSAATVDWGSVEQTFTSTDGDVNIWGPMLYVTGRAPNSTRCTPFAELGWATYFASFDEDPAWAAAAPGYRFEVDNTTGYFWGLGLDFEINSHWSVDVYWRQMNNAEVEARAYFTTSSRVGRYGAFPMDYDMYGIGVNYHF